MRWSPQPVAGWFVLRNGAELWWEAVHRGLEEWLRGLPVKVMSQGVRVGRAQWEMCCCREISITRTPAKQAHSPFIVILYLYLHISRLEMGTQRELWEWVNAVGVWYNSMDLIDEGQACIQLCPLTVECFFNNLSMMKVALSFSFSLPQG